MKKSIFTTRGIAISAALAAISATVQLIHIGYQSPQFGMWIDIVAVSWIIAYFLLGMRLALLVTCVGSLIITLFAPDTWLGASMKLLATVPIIVSLAFVKKDGLDHPISLIIPILFGMLVRCLIVIPVNYYYAIPIWTGLTPQKAMVVIPWFIIAGFNIAQSILDVSLAWIIVYKFKLIRFKQVDQI